VQAGNPLTFYETSSYGPQAIVAMSSVVGPGQLVYGSDRPVVQPQSAFGLDWGQVSESTVRALTSSSLAVLR
jgi:hypothetical protein